MTARRLSAAAGSILFFLLAPSVVAGVVPWSLTRWQASTNLHVWLPLRIVGGAALLVGIVVMVHAFVRFVTEGVGTPAPVAPTRHLVVGGLYRHVRNPMYVALQAAILGQALLLGRPVLLGYAALVWVATASFVHFYEEPTLLATYGDEYAAYRRAVRAWWPRLRPARLDASRTPVSRGN
jgi:protein-S-isoprenylcysteine O-methyltransferase Ste14